MSTFFSSYFQIEVILINAPICLVTEPLSGLQWIWHFQTLKELYFLGRRITKANIPPTPNIPEPLTFEEAQKMVQFEVDGVACRWNINEPLEIISKVDLEEVKAEIKIETPQGED